MAKYWSIGFSNSPSDEYSGLIFFWIDWFDLLAVQETLKHLLQHHNLKASILWCSALMVQFSLTSVHDYWKNHSFNCTSYVCCDPHSQRLSRRNKAEVDVLLEFLCFLHDPKNVGNLISGSSVSLKPSLNIWKFSVHILLKPSLENFEHYFASLWDECNFGHSLALPFFGIGMKTDLFSPVATAEFSEFALILSVALS